MTQDEIIEMAKQTHLPYFWETGVPCNLSGLEAFAKLVAAKEREACAKLIEPSEDHRANPNDYIAEEQGIELLDGIAAKIRARGEA
jgi:hypothetical protein